MPSEHPLLHRLALAATAALPLALCACAPPQQAYTVYNPVLVEPPPSPAPPGPFPEGQPVVPQVSLELEEGLPNPANAVCMSAVGERAGDFNVRVLGNETVAAGTEVTLGVGKDQARWRCLAHPSGAVLEVGKAPEAAG